MINRVLLAGLLLAVSPLALAERPPSYWAVSLGQYEFTDPQGNITETTNIGLEGGFQFFPWLGLELRVGGQASSADDVLESSDIAYGGAFARFDVPYERVNLYLLAGAGSVGYTDPMGNDETESGAAGGVGVELYGSERSAVKLELMHYAAGDAEYQGLSLGFVHHFDWAAPGR